MRVPREVIRRFLQERQQKAWGVSSQDLAGFARTHGLNSKTFSKRVLILLRTDPLFQGIRYVGKRTTSVTMDDYLTLSDTLQQAPMTPTSVLVANLNMARQAQGLPPIPPRTAFDVVHYLSLGLARNKDDPLSWFTTAKVPVSSSYSLDKAHISLGTLFTWSELATKYGVSLTKTLARIEEAEEFFATLYPGLSFLSKYEEVMPRASIVPGFLASITLERAPALAARFIFEQQVLWLCQARDLVLSQIPFRKERLVKSINDRIVRKAFGQLQKQYGQGQTLAVEYLSTPSPPKQEALSKWAREPERERERAQASLRLSQRAQFNKLKDALATLTRDFHPDEVSAHNKRTLTLLQIARGERQWDELTNRERVCLGKNRHLLDAVPTEDQQALRGILLTERLADAFAQGKLTVVRSWTHQDLGARIRTTVLPETEEDRPLTQSSLDAIISGTYLVDLSPLKDVGVPGREGDATSDEGGYWSPKEEFTDMAWEVHEEVRARHLEWFSTHCQVLEDVWEGGFRMEYDEDAFAKRLMLAIGYLGGNFRIRDDPRYASLLHFLRRCVTPATLDTEMKFYQDTLVELTGQSAEVLLVDTVGIEGQRTHPQSTYHPRYHTKGFAAMRGIGKNLVPIYSIPCSSRETEAMNALELVAKARNVAGQSIRIYGGNGHTVSRISAALLWGTFKVVSAGFITHEPPPLSARDEKDLREHLDLLNRTFLLLREKPELGRLFSSRTHVYVDGVNVRHLMERLGQLVIRAALKVGYDGRAFQPYIESSNRTFRVVRIVERGTTRVEPHRQGLSVLATELITAMVALRSCLSAEKGSYVQPVINMEGVAMFRPL
jgi:hypothetical protein